MGTERGRRKSGLERVTPTAAVAAFVPLGALLPEIGPAPRQDAAPPCHLCSALCCKYYALPIDAPKTPADHDEVRWYLLHENSVVWVQDGDWYLEVRNRCRHLQPDNSCGIYDTRPQICRDYGLPGTEGPCEYFTQDLAYDLFFDSAEAFEVWSRDALEKRRARLERRRARRVARQDGAGSREAVGA